MVTFCMADVAHISLHLLKEMILWSTSVWLVSHPRLMIGVSGVSLEEMVMFPRESGERSAGEMTPT